MGADRTKATEVATVDAYILAAHRKGTSTRDIAAGLKRDLGVTRSKTAIQKRLDAAELAGEPVRKSGRRRPVLGTEQGGKTNDKKRGPDADTTDELEAAGAIDRAREAGAVPESSDEDVDTTRVRLRRLRDLIDRNEARMLSGEMAPAAWATLVRLETELTDRVVAQVVPAPPRPEDDPQNVETAARARAKLAQLVRAAEADARCASCGADPWAPRRTGT